MVIYYPKHVKAHIYIYIQIHFKVTLDGVIKIYSNSKLECVGKFLVNLPSTNILLALSDMLQADGRGATSSCESAGRHSY
jgi:hypothetical protein